MVSKNSSGYIKGHKGIRKKREDYREKGREREEMKGRTEISAGEDPVS